MNKSATVARVVGRMDDVAAIYDAHHAELFGYATSLVRNTSTAEDLVHEAFARLVRQRTQDQMPDEPRAWLFRVCTNLALSGSRRRAIVDRWQHLVGRVAAMDDQEEAAELTVVRRERHAELMRALDRMPADHRAALLLAAEGFTGREIAHCLRRSEGSTRTILWRARLALRDLVERGGIA
jgi:RNA polymerase sigma-70 factor, ECF subfamily